MLHIATIPCDAVKDIVSSLKRIIKEENKSYSEGRALLSFVRLQITPRGDYVELEATACNGYFVARLTLQCERAKSQDQFTTYFVPFPYRPGKTCVLRQDVTFTFDDETRESTVILPTLMGSITYKYNCKSVVDDYARFSKTIEGLYDGAASAKRAVHYVDPFLLKSAVLSSTEIYRKSLKLSIPEDDHLGPIELATMSGEGTRDRSHFVLLQLPIRGEDY